MKKQKKKDDGNKRLVRKGARTSTRIKHTEEEIRHVNLMPLFPVLFDPSQANCRSSSEKEGTVSRNRRSRRCQILRHLTGARERKIRAQFITQSAGRLLIVHEFPRRI